MLYASFWKQNNRKVSDQFVGSNHYWERSPSNILLYNASKDSLSKYAINKTVLDAGAGRMAYKKLINMFAKKYISLDFQQTHANLDVIADIEKMSVNIKNIDVVFCSQVLEHVPHPWLAMKEIHSVLKKNGIVIITVPHLAYLHNLPYDFYRYTEGGLRSMSEYAGFKIIKIKPLGGFFCFLGYIRSTLLMPLMNIPILGGIILKINHWFGLVDILFDKLTKNYKIFPLNYLLIAKKS